jgi:hypothetical protein
MDQYEEIEYKEQTLPRRRWNRGKPPPLIHYIREAMRYPCMDAKIPLVSRFEEKDIFARYETNMDLIWNRTYAVIEMRQSVRRNFEIEHWIRTDTKVETRIRTTADPESFVCALLLDFESLQFHGTIPNYAAPIPMIWEMESSLRTYVESVAVGQTRKRRRDEMEKWRLIRPYA